MCVLSHWVASNFLMSAVYCLAKSGVNIFTLVLSSSEICVQQKFCELQYTDTVHYVQNRRLMLSVLSNFLILKRLKTIWSSLSFLKGKIIRDHFSLSLSAHFIYWDVYVHVCKCVCV